jgi:tripartite ATP-independent transporter DctP family solute receptor
MRETKEGRSMKVFRSMVCAAILAGVVAPAAAATKITLGSANGAKDFGNEAMVRWADALRKASGGELQMDVIVGGSLGGDKEMLQQLSNDEIQLHIAGPVVVHFLAQPYQCMEAEYVFDDQDQGLKIWRGPLGQEVSKALEDKYGITIVGVGKRGARDLTSNKAIKEPDDLKGVKVRVTNKLRADVFRAYGALPAPVPINELYGALRQGVVDAQENPIPTIYGNKFYEVQKFIDLTGHVQSYYVVSANKKFLAGLTAAQRKAFDSTLAESIAWLDQTVENDTKALLEKMEKSGVTVVHSDVPAFKKIAAPIVKAYAEKNCRPNLLDDINRLAR